VRIVGRERTGATVSRTLTTSVANPVRFDLSVAEHVTVVVWLAIVPLAVVHITGKLPSTLSVAENVKVIGVPASTVIAGGAAAPLMSTTGFVTSRTVRLRTSGGSVSPSASRRTATTLGFVAPFGNEQLNATKSPTPGSRSPNGWTVW